MRNNRRQRLGNSNMELRAAIKTWHEHIVTSRAQTRQSPSHRQLNEGRVLIAGEGAFEKATG